MGRIAWEISGHAELSVAGLNMRGLVCCQSLRAPPPHGGLAPCCGPSKDSSYYKSTLEGHATQCIRVRSRAVRSVATVPRLVSGRTPQNLSPRPVASRCKAVPARRSGVGLWTAPSGSPRLACSYVRAQRPRAGSILPGPKPVLLCSIRAARKREKPFTRCQLNGHTGARGSQPRGPMVPPRRVELRTNGL